MITASTSNSRPSPTTMLTSVATSTSTSKKNNIVKFLILIQCILVHHDHVNAIHMRRSFSSMSTSTNYRVGINDNTRNINGSVGNQLCNAFAEKSECRQEKKQKQQRQKQQSENILGDIVHTLRGGASEVVDDDDRGLVSEEEHSNSIENKEDRIDGALSPNTTIVVEEEGEKANNISIENDLTEDTDTDDNDEEDDESEDEEEEEDTGVDSDEEEIEIEQDSIDEYDDEEETEDSEEENQDQDPEYTATETPIDEPESNDNLSEDDTTTAITPTAPNDDIEKSSSSPSFQETVDSKQTEASNLRIQGKQLHDDGDFQSAANTFQKAASELDFVISIYEEKLDHNHNHNDDQQHDQQQYLDDGSYNSDFNNNNSGEYENNLSHSDFLMLNEERATCRLHEALCHLKNKNYAASIISCTDVLMDGVQIVPFTEEYDNEEDNNDEEETQENEDGVSNAEGKQHQAVVVRISPNGGGGKTATSAVELSPAVRARAYHRRAKARLALEDTTGALDDARSAAFLGDRNAVALYGKLMRESGSNSNIFGGSSGVDGDSGSGADFGSLFSSASPLQSLFSGDANEGGAMSTPSSFDMLSSILGGPGDGANAPSPFGAMGGLGSLLGGINPLAEMGNGGGGGMDGLVKSVLSSVTKRIDDESTQEMVCRYLNGVDESQIASLSSMAGVSLSTSTVERIVGFANGVNPKGMRKTIKLVKRLLLVGNVLRKTFQVIGKYKHLLVVVLLIAWMKSAILRPVVVGKKAAKKTVETISKAAFII